VKTLRGIPTSRAYWELRAEQMMNRIFAPEPAIDLDPGSAPESAASPGGRGDRPEAPALPPSPEESAAATAPPSAPAASAAPPRRREQPILLLTLLGGVCMVSAASSVLYLGHWNGMQQTLRQERNLLLMERLRSLGPATPASLAGRSPADPPPTPLPAAPAATNPGLPAPVPGSDLPPPPPEEPWMDQLGELPPSPQAQAPVLRVPVSPQLPAPAPPAQTEIAAAGPLPELLGVVAAPGKAGSAIFQVGGTSSNVGVGQAIGSSGWRLRSAEGDTVLIERGGQVRRLSIGNGG
jgi:hypothetical protein